MLASIREALGLNVEPTEEEGDELLETADFPERTPAQLARGMERHVVLSERVVDREHQEPFTLAAVSEVRWAPRRPRFTPRPPTTEGLWYLRIAPGSPRLVVEVYRDEHGTWLFRWSDIKPRPLVSDETKDFMWAGPLPEPIG